MQPIHLYHVNAEANMARFYCIDVAPTLFGDVSVLRTWGRIGTHGRMSVETCASAEEAEKAAALTLRQKKRRGYSDADSGTASSVHYAHRGVEAGLDNCYQVCHLWFRDWRTP